MTLKKRLQDDLSKAMREKDELRRDTLRMVIADLENKRIELGRDLTDEDAIAVLQKGKKSREDSAAQYEAAGRAELAAKERAEIAVIEAYLPQPLGEDEAREAVRAAIEETGASGKQDLGKVMKAVMAKHRGRLDGKTAQRLAAELLG